MSAGKELYELSRLRTIAFLRQPEAVFWVFAFPVILAAILGYAFQGSEVAVSRVGVLTEVADGADGAGVEGGLLARLAATPHLELVRYADRAAADVALFAGKIDALVLDPETSPPTLRLDPARAQAELARLRVLCAVTGAEEDRLALERVEEHGSRYVDFLFPGLLGMNLMGTGLWSIGFAIADHRQRKLLKRMLVTPMRRTTYLASFLVSRLIFLVAEVGILTGFAVWVLGVPFRGNPLLFATLCLFGALAFAGLGLLAAARVQTIEGISGMLNLVMMPMWLGSGVFFSYERFPEVIQPLLRVLPLTALNDALRASMLEGAGLGAVLPEILIMAAWLVLPFAIALRIFRWT